MKCLEIWYVLVLVIIPVMLYITDITKFSCQFHCNEISSEVEQWAYQELLTTAKSWGVDPWVQTCGPVQKLGPHNHLATTTLAGKRSSQHQGRLLPNRSDQERILAFLLLSLTSAHIPQAIAKVLIPPPQDCRVCHDAAESVPNFSKFQCLCFSTLNSASLTLGTHFPVSA